MYKNHSGWPYLLRKRMWERIGGNENMVQFMIYPRDEMRYHGMLTVVASTVESAQRVLMLAFLWKDLSVYFVSML